MGVATAVEDHKDAKTQRTKDSGTELRVLDDLVSLERIPPCETADPGPLELRGQKS